MEMTKLGHGVAAALLSFFLLWVGDKAADLYQLPFIHGWALMHGAILVVFPVYFVVAYLVLLPFVRRIERTGGTGSTNEQRLSGLAVTSLLVSGAGFFLPFIGSGLGLLTGHVARRHCRNNPKLGGAGFALAGLILGYIGLLMWAYGFGLVAWVAWHDGS